MDAGIVLLIVLGTILQIVVIIYFFIMTKNISTIKGIMQGSWEKSLLDAKRALSKGDIVAAKDLCADAKFYAERGRYASSFMKDEVMGKINSTLEKIKELDK